jgi:hypothetical protein
MGISMNTRVIQSTATQPLEAMDLPAQLQTGHAPLAQARKRGRPRPQTVGFSALRKELKRVTFDPPLYARCMSIDGMWSMDCLVMSVWDSGARLQARWPREIREFFLLFTSSVKPVYRRCKRVRMRGQQIEVEYQRMRPSFALAAESAHPELASRA